MSKIILKQVDRGYMHGKMWDYQLAMFRLHIVPRNYYSSIGEVVTDTLWWIRHPKKWRWVKDEK